MNCKETWRTARRHEGALHERTAVTEPGIVREPHVNRNRTVTPDLEWVLRDGQVVGRESLDAAVLNCLRSRRIGS
jgi:hypothetical protein